MKTWKRAALSLATVLLGAANPASASDFNYESLRNLIRSKSLHSIDEVIAALPEDFSQFYTFMYQSRSLQRDFTTPQAPRAIVYGPDAKFILSFTQGTKGTEHDAIELMSWSDRSSRFTLNELSFDHSGQLEISQDNPAKCTRCHGETVRPIFDPYRMWPGAYGSLSAAGKDRIGAGTKEAALYVDFIKHYRYVGRYKTLPRERLSGDDARNQYGDIVVSNGSVKEPNADLTRKLIGLNDQRVAHWVAESPRFHAFKYSLKALNDGCYKDVSVEDFFPSAERAAGHSYSELKDDTLKRVIEQFKARRDATVAFNRATRVPLDQNFPLEAQALRKTARFRYILERMGLDPTLARLGIENADFDLSDGSQRTNEVHYIDMAEAIAKLGAHRDRHFSGMDCDDLQRASLRQFDAYTPLPPRHDIPGGVAPAPRTGIALLQDSCMDCHSGASSYIPALPFNSEAELRQGLAHDPHLMQELHDRLTGNGVSQMPLGGALPSDQLTSLLKYIDSIE